MNYGQVNHILQQGDYGAKQATMPREEANQQNYGLYRASGLHEKSISELADALGVLTERLAPLTINRPAREEKLGSVGISTEARLQSPIVSAMTSMTYKLNELTRRLREQVETLDL